VAAVPLWPESREHTGVVSEENVARARRVYEAWNAHDWDRVVAEVDAAHHLHLTGLLPGLKPEYDGKDGLREFLESFDAIWTDLKVDVERIEDAGDRVVGLVRIRGTATGSGVPVSIEYAHVFHLVGERAVRTEGFRTWREALESAGLKA
jgi:ketosteroid isomerase-like protein